MSTSLISSIRSVIEFLWSVPLHGRAPCLSFWSPIARYNQFCSISFEDKVNSKISNEIRLLIVVIRRINVNDK